MIIKLQYAWSYTLKSYGLLLVVVICLFFMLSAFQKLQFLREVVTVDWGKARHCVQG